MKKISALELLEMKQVHGGVELRIKPGATWTYDSCICRGSNARSKIGDGKIYVIVDFNSDEQCKKSCIDALSKPDELLRIAGTVKVGNTTFCHDKRVGGVLEINDCKVL